MKSLSDEGVDLTFARTVAGARTQIAFIIIDERNGERTVIWQRDELLAFSEADAPAGAVARAKVLHFTPHDTAACLALAREGKEACTIVSIDIDNLFDGVDDVLGHTDILISSAEFPAKLLLIDDPKVALREMKMRFGCGIVGVTLGANGSLLLCDDTFIETNGRDVPGGCRDTTGAGDAFRVGLIYGLLNGYSVEEAAMAANAVAALKCREIGARTALPNEKELKKFIAEGGS
jgi:sugar/nucleoside kinase (ribokinase family)